MVPTLAPKPIRGSELGSHRHRWSRLTRESDNVARFFGSYKCLSFCKAGRPPAACSSGTFTSRRNHDAPEDFSLRGIHLISAAVAKPHALKQGLRPSHPARSSFPTAGRDCLGVDVMLHAVIYSQKTSILHNISQGGGLHK